MLWKVFQHSTCMSTYYQKYFWNSTCMSTYYQKYSNIDCVCQQTIEGISTYRKYVKILSKVFWHSVSMSKDNQKYVKTLAKVCRKKKYVTALKSMSTTSKSMSQHTEYVKSSPIFLMVGGQNAQRGPFGRWHCRWCLEVWRSWIGQPRRRKDAGAGCVRRKWRREVCS